MALKLDTSIPQVWRDPFSLQFGVDPARVVLREVTSAQESLLWALSSGISRSGLDMIGRSAGVEERGVARLLKAVEPILETSDARAALLQPAVSIVGTGATMERIAEALADAGSRVTVTPSPDDEPCDLGIVVGHYVLDPPSYGFWLRRDIPHLPVIFGDACVTIGPLIEPGNGPCLYCLEHHRRDADPAWSAIASQLWGRRSAAETALVSREAAALAARLVMQYFESHRSEADSRAFRVFAAATSFRLSSATGQVTRTEWMPHPECGCVAIPDAAVPVTAVRPGTDSVGGPRRDGRPRRPTTAAAVAGLA